MATFGQGISVSASQSFSGSGAGTLGVSVYTVPAGMYAIITQFSMQQTAGNPGPASSVTFSIGGITAGSASGAAVASTSGSPSGGFYAPAGTVISFSGSANNPIGWAYKVAIITFANT